MPEDVPDKAASEPPVPDAEFSAPVDGNLWDGPPLEESWSDADSGCGDGSVEVLDAGLDTFDVPGLSGEPVLDGPLPGVFGEGSDTLELRYRFLRGALLESRRAVGLRADGTMKRIWKDADTGSAFVGPTPTEQAALRRGQTPDGKVAPRVKGRKRAFVKRGWKGKSQDQQDSDQNLHDLLGRFRHELE